MKITYKNNALKKVCENDSIAIRIYGASCAKRIRNRLYEIKVAKKVGELKAGRPHPLRENRKGQIAVTLTKNMRLIFQDAGQSDSESITDWKDIEAVQIIEITDYHD